MKKILRRFALALAALGLAGMTETAEASHWQGSELNYACVAPGVYTVTLKLYRDCSGIAASPTAALTLKSPGCSSSGRVVTLNKVGNPVLGNAYCSQISPGCGAVYPNYQEEVYTNTLIFTAAEQSCVNWTMSWTECCRPNVANLVNATSSSLYTEAYINLSSGINNNSPQFGSLVVPFVNHRQPILLSSFAIDPDTEDSLVYSLKDPLTDENTPIAFSSYQPFLYYNSDSTKSVLLPGGNFSKNFPILSYYVDWTKPMPITPVQKFHLDTKTGSIAFIPNKFEPNTTSAQGKNKYVMVVQVDEYRKINGVPTKIGSVRRDMFITIIDCGPNQNPYINAPVANGQAIAETDVINLRPGTPLNLQFATADGNAANILTLESDVTSILPGAVFTKTSANQPTGTITWTPPANAVRDQVYYFHITVQDNACPVKGVQTHTFGVRVRATGSVTGVNEGNALPRFVAYPNPYSETVSFKVNIAKNAAQKLVIYNVLGQEVDKIDLKGFATGEQTIIWNKASKMAKGQYVAKLVSNQKEIQTIQFSKLQ